MVGIGVIPKSSELRLREKNQETPPYFMAKNHGMIIEYGMIQYVGNKQIKCTHIEHSIKPLNKAIKSYKHIV